MSAEDQRERADDYLGHPGFASRADEERRRCKIDGGYFGEDGRCEHCELTGPETEVAATDRGARYSLVAVYHDGNPETWAQFTDPALAIDVAARLRERMRVPFVGVGDRERDGHGWIDEDDLAEES